MNAAPDHMLDQLSPEGRALQESLRTDTGLDWLEQYLELDVLERARTAHPAEFAAHVRQIGRWHCEAFTALGGMREAVKQIEKWGAS